MRSKNSLYLYRRSGIFQIGYTDKGRLRWKSTGCHKRAEALLALSDFKKLLKCKPRESSLKAFVKEFLEYAATVYAPGNTDLYRRALRLFEEAAGDRALSEITARHVDAFKVKRLKQVKPVSFNIELRAIRAALQTAVRWKMLEENPAKSVREVAVPEEPPIFLTKEAFDTLIRSINIDWFKEMVVLAVLTGLRRGELLNLQWPNVDLKRRILHIHSGVGFRTKQGKRRIVPLSETAFYVLTTMDHSSQYVFQMDGRKIREDYVTRRFKQYVRDAKLEDQRVHFHSLRHTFASWLVQQGASLYEVQKLLGHSNARITQVYSHLLPNEMHSTVNRIAIPFK